MAGRGRVRGSHSFDKFAAIIIKSLESGDPNDAFSSEDVMLVLRVSAPWLDGSRVYGFGPAYEKTKEGLVCYRRGKLIEYLKQRQEFYQGVSRGLVVTAPRPTWPASKPKPAPAAKKPAPTPVKRPIKQHHSAEAAE